jgi:hypothetical protein
LTVHTELSATAEWAATEWATEAAAAKWTAEAAT